MSSTEPAAVVGHLADLSYWIDADDGWRLTIRLDVPVAEREGLRALLAAYRQPSVQTVRLALVPGSVFPSSDEAGKREPIPSGGANSE
jgi:hypothetical protein